MEVGLREGIQLGLGRASHPTASVKCFPTYVRQLPTGRECGRFLALDLGGTNFRVVLMEIEQDQQFSMDSEIYAVPEVSFSVIYNLLFHEFFQSVMRGPGAGLFDHIASCLSEFTASRSIQSECLPLGFTFSFPCRQVATM